MGKHIFNDVFSEILNMYRMDSVSLGAMADRDPSRIRHYKTDSKPDKNTLERLIKSINERITDINDYYINNIVMAKLNRLISDKMIFSKSIQDKLFEIKDICEYIPFLLRRCHEFCDEKSTSSEDKNGISSEEKNSLIYKINQANDFYEHQCIDEAKHSYEEIIQSPMLEALPKYARSVYANLGLIYRNDGVAQHEPGLLQKSIDYLNKACTLSLKENDAVNTGIIYKNLGTVYTFMFNFSDPESNLKKASVYYDSSLEVLNVSNAPDEEIKVYINYGIVYIYYSYIRNSVNYLKMAIRYFMKAIEYYQSRPWSFFKALSFLNCSGAYCLLAELSNTKLNADQAICMIENALEFFTVEDYPGYYAQCISNLGEAYYALANSFDPVINCKKAIHYIEASLHILPSDKDLSAYSIAHLNLSAAYTLLSQYEDPVYNIHKAVQSIKECKKYINMKTDSINALKVCMNYAEVLINLAEVDESQSTLEESGTIVCKLIDAFSSMKCDYYRAATEATLSRVKLLHFKKSQDVNYLNQALIYASKSLEVITITDYPLLFARITYLIAKIYHYNKSYESCKEKYECALRIFTSEKYPEKHKQILSEYNAALMGCPPTVQHIYR